VKTGFILSLIAVAGVAFTGCTPHGGTGAAEKIEIDMGTVTQDLQRISQARILLGHQSVGRNILAGLDQLASDAGIPVRVIEVNGAPPDDAPGLFHSNVGQNRDPDSKCEVFGQLLTGFDQPKYDVAAMKFCYVDLGRDTPTEVGAMLDRYQRLVDDLRTQRPDVQLMHITMPLKSDMPGRKTTVKRMLGMSMPNDADNVLRNAFNDQLRERYAGEPIFDLAAVESTLPNGTRSGFKHDSKLIFTLAAEYTNDGGHLVGASQRLAAAAFVRALAQTLQSAPQSVVGNHE
jgi:hypothetical protein